MHRRFIFARPAVATALGLLAALLASLVAATAPAAAKEVTIRHGQLVLNARLEEAGGKGLKGKEVVLIVHGTLAHNRMETIATMQRLLAERGLASLAINLSLGISNRHNMYDCNQPMRHRHEDAVAEIAAWTNWLKRQGVKTIWLMGHSRGGAQAAWFAATRAPAEVKGVILLAPMTHDAQREAAKYRQRFGAPLAPMLAQARDFLRAGHGHEPMELPGILYCRDARATPRSFLSYHGPDPRRGVGHWLRRIAVPVLVIAGAEDEVVPDLVEKVKPLVDGKRIRLVTIEDADHFFRDFSAEDAANKIVEFIRNIR